MKISELSVYQKDILTILENSYTKNKLVHAYLFEGNTGSGTFEMAQYMAMKLLCQDRHTKPCMHCNSCNRVLANSHLNVLVIEPIDDMIRKEQIEELIKEFSMTSLESGPKIAIVKDIDKINNSGGNTLLKFLEEPTENHYTFLLTTNKGKVLDTIISRCQLLHFKPLSASYIITKLVDRGVDLDMSYVLSNITTDEDQIQKLLEEGVLANILNLAKQIVKERITNKDAFVKYYESKDILLTQTDKFYHRAFLDILILIYQEIYKKVTSQSMGYFESIINSVNKDTIKQQEIVNKLDLINKYQEKLNYNVNLDLFYTSLFIEL